MTASHQGHGRRSSPRRAPPPTQRASTPAAEVDGDFATIDPKAEPDADWTPFDPTLAPAPGGTEHKITLRATETELEVAPV
jgi:nitrite reductase (NO-forming)